jgi:hypothetical protein
VSVIVDQLGERLKPHWVDLAREAGQLAVTQTQAAVSRRSGALFDGISTSEPALEDTRVTQQITSAADYSKFQDDGTGIYGPTGARIFPKTAKVLRFDSPAAGGIVFARSVAGSPGRHFFSEPMAARWHDCLAQNVGGPI